MSSVVTTKVTESDAHLVIRFDLQSDGIDELINYPILYPSDLNPPRANNGPAFRIMQVWYGLVWFDVTFSISSIKQPNVLWTLARDCDSHTDFRSFGGLIDTVVYDSPATVDTGVLLITTNGFAVPGSRGSLVLELRKTNTP